MKPQAEIIPFESERDRLLGQAMHQLLYAIVLIRNEPIDDSLGLACALVKDAAGILDACTYFKAEPHSRHYLLDLDRLDRLVEEHR